MSDTPTAPWLEDDSEFEGVGAHRLNPRYDHIEADVPAPAPPAPTPAPPA